MQDHRLALDRPRHVERPAHGEEPAGMLDRMHVIGIGESAARLVDDEAAILPAVPELARDVDQLDQARRGVLFGGGQVGVAETGSPSSCASLQAGDPAGASRGEMIERREDPRDMKRLGDVARPPAAEADPLGGADHCRQRAAADRAVCHRPCRRRARPRSGRQAQQHRIEAALFGRLRHRPEGRGAGEGRRAGHAPGGRMPAMGRERSQKMHRHPLYGEVRQKQGGCHRPRQLPTSSLPMHDERFIVCAQNPCEHGASDGRS